jgi:uncharacterized RDD family membrane protein YckC
LISHPAMKKIEITTAQKVTIQYELASLRDRILAFTVDAIIWSAALLILFFINTALALDNPELYMTLNIMLLVPVFVFYTLAFEVLMHGQTPGKKALGLKVVRLNGKIPSFDDFLVRWVFRWIDIYTSFGAIAALLVSAGDKSQRLGGLLSNTAVVKLKSGYHIRLKDLESMFASEDYTPAYPQVTQFNDEDMLAVKELIRRYLSYPNAAHRKLVLEIADILGKRMALPPLERDRLAFLKAVVKDYVMLTR